MINDKKHIKEHLKLELEEVKHEILNPLKIEVQRLREISFYLYNENMVDRLVDFVNDKKLLADIVYCIKAYRIKPLVIYKLLILYYNLKFNEKENLSDNKTRFETQIEIKKQNFDNIQKYSNVDLSLDLPRIKSDLLYEFREVLRRYEFATDEEIKILLNILGIKKLPKEPNNYKQLVKEWRTNIVNSLKSKNTENINEAVKTANQYKPTKN